LHGEAAACARMANRCELAERERERRVLAIALVPARMLAVMNAGCRRARAMI